MHTITFKRALQVVCDLAQQAVTENEDDEQREILAEQNAALEMIETVVPAMAGALRWAEKELSGFQNMTGTPDAKLAEIREILAQVEGTPTAAPEVFRHLPHRCPSMHHNRGDDICEDCGEDLNASDEDAAPTSETGNSCERCGFFVRPTPTDDSCDCHPTAAAPGATSEAVGDVPELGRFCLQDYRSLANGLREMIDSGRLSVVDLPDDFDWIESKLSYLSHHDKGAADCETLAAMRARYPMQGEG